MLKLPQGKDLLPTLVKGNVNSICQCLGKRYGSLIEDDEIASSKETRQADETAHTIAKLLNSNVWMPEANKGCSKLQLET